MPRADEPRVMVRLSGAEHAMLKAQAESVNASLGGFIRECAVRHGGVVAREIASGSVTVRRARAVQAVKGQVAPASTLLPVPDYMRERQARVNASIERARGG
jgi:uncharacterized protein (DUF1778 family)